MIQNSVRGVFLLLIAANFRASASEQNQAESTTSSPSLSQQQASLSWLSEAGKAYVLKAVLPPPASGSDKDKADVQAVLKAQGLRTADVVDEALADQKFSSSLMARVISSDFTPEKYPITFKLLNRVLADQSFLNAKLKAQYKRPRPYQDHPEVKALFKADQYSYPSEHASASRILVLVLTILFPDKSMALLNRDEIIAQSRVNAGVNHPSDVIGGRALAHALIFVIQDDPVFQHDLTDAKNEIAAKIKPDTASNAK